MFDSDNIPLVTRIEAGFGVAVSYSTNSDSEAVYRVTVDSEQIVQLIARVINAGTSGVRNDADSDLVSSVTNVFTAGEGIEITEIPASGGAGTITVNVSAVDANEATITFSDEDDAIAFAALDTITGGGPDTQVIALGSNNFGASASTLVSDVVEVLWSRGGDLATGNSLLNISTAAAPLSVSRSGSVVTLTLDSSVAAHTSQSGTGWVERSNVVFTTETSDNLGYTFFDTPGNYYSVDSGVSSTIASTPVVEASTQIAATNSGGFDSDQVVAIIAANASSSVQPVQVVRWQLDLDAGTIIVDLDSDIQGYLSGGLDVTSVTYGFNNQSPGSAAIDPDSDAASTYTLTNSTASAFAFRYTITLSTKDLNEIKRLGANIASSYLRVNTEALTLQGNYYFRGNSADEMHWQGRPFVYSQDITAPQINLAAYKTGDSDGGARLTLTFSEIVDVSTFDVGHITLGDDIVQTNSRVLSSGSNLQTTVDSDTVIIEIADSDRAAIAPLITGGIANELYMALTSATVTDLDGNPVTPVTQFDGFPIDITQPMASMADIDRVGQVDSDYVTSISRRIAQSIVDSDLVEGGYFTPDNFAAGAGVEFVSVAGAVTSRTITVTSSGKTATITFPTEAIATEFAALSVPAGSLAITRGSFRIRTVDNDFPKAFPYYDGTSNFLSIGSSFTFEEYPSGVTMTSSGRDVTVTIPSADAANWTDQTDVEYTGAFAGLTQLAEGEERWATGSPVTIGTAGASTTQLVTLNNNIDSDYVMTRIANSILDSEYIMDTVNSVIGNITDSDFVIMAVQDRIDSELTNKINPRLARIETRANADSDRLVNIDSDVTTLQSDVTTLQSDVTTLQTSAGFDSDQVVAIITENASSSVQGVTVLASELVIGTANPVITLTLDSDITGYLSGGFDVTNVSVGVTDSDIGADSEAINSYTLTNSTVRPGTSGGQRVIIDLSRKDLNEIKRLGPTSAATSYLRVGSGAFTFQGNYYFQGNSTDGMTWQANPTIFVGDSIAPGVIAGSVYSPGDSELGARLTITLDEIVDVSTFEPRAITLQDFIDFSGPPITQRQLSSGSNVLTTVDSDAVTIAISASDRTAIAPLIASGFGNNQLFFVLDNFTLVSDLSSLPYDASRQGTTTNPFEIIVDQPMASMTDIDRVGQVDSEWVYSVVGTNVLDSDDVQDIINNATITSDVTTLTARVDSDAEIRTNLNAVTSDVETLTTRVDADSDRLTTLTTRVADDSDRLTTVDTNVTTLTARVDSDLDLRTDLNLLTGRVVDVERHAELVDSDFVITTMTNSAIDSDYILNQIDTAIGEFTDSDFVVMAIQNRIDSELTNNINPRFTTIENRIGADSDRLTTVDTNVTTLTARVDSDAEVRTNLNAVTSDVTTLTARVDSDAEVRTNLNVVTSDVTTLTSRVDSDAEIRTNLNAVTSDITTLTSRVDADSDRLVSVNASVTTRLVSVETQTSALDSDWVIRTANESGKVDSDYVERRVIAAQQNTVDSDYVERRVIAAQQNTVDSDWVMARLTELDSDEINTLITAKIRNVQFDSEWTVSMVRSVVKDASDSDKALIRSDIIIVQGNLDSEVARLDIAVDVATDSERFERIERVLQIGAFAPATVAAVVAASADSEYIAYSHDRTTTTDIQFRYRIVDGDVTIHSGLVQVGDGLNEVQVLRALSAVVNTDTIAKRYISRFTLVGNAIEYGFASTFADYSIAIDVESSNDGSVFTVYPVQ
mgnify:CR=1 FL=1